MFGPTCSLTYSYSTTIDCSLLFCTLVLSKNMHHLSVVTLWLLTSNGWNTSIRSLALCSSCFLSSCCLLLCLCTLVSKVAYFMIQEASNWQSFFIHTFAGSKFCPSLIDNISLRILCRNIRNCTLFCITGRNCLSTGYATAAKLVCSNTIYIYIYIYSPNNKNS